MSDPDAPYVSLTVRLGRWPLSARLGPRGARLLAFAMVASLAVVVLEVAAGLAWLITWAA